MLAASIGWFQPSPTAGDNTTIFIEQNAERVMKLILRIEKFFDVLMSFATLVGFASTAFLAWTFLNTKPGPITSGTSNIGVPGFSLAQYPTLIIQGVPFFWNLLQPSDTISRPHISFGETHHTISRGKELLPHAPHLMHTQPTPTPTAPRLRQTESSQ
ncbi:hypothetical protein AUF78_01220 [archaeon 13_1_20CM_2_51_12]|nr:MAG: hypothetical protein AUF78_01220 [archaeon 13_1_20CM_2_51_12]